MKKQIVTYGLLLAVLSAKPATPRLSAQPILVTPLLLKQSSQNQIRPVVLPTLNKRLQAIDRRQIITEDSHDHGEENHRHSHDTIGVRQTIKSIGNIIFSFF